MIDKYLVNESSTLINTLKVIDKNKKGFVIVVDEENHLKGTVSDGDIRRALIKGFELNSSLSSIISNNCKKISVEDGISKAIDIFKDEKIKFLPIIDKNNKVINVLTKYQLHSLLLQDIKIDLNYDFDSVDETLIDHEIFQRPWGFYKTTVMNDYCQSKVICVYPDSKLSLQSHDHREEHWIVAHGEGKVQIGESILDAKCGDSFFIPKGCKHRITNISKTENLIINEVQIGDYFGEDDIHRYEDIYGRL